MTAPLELRPSSAYRWWGGGCTAYPRMVAGLPSESSEAAAEGTRLHELAAEWLLGRIADVPAEDRPAVQPYLDDVMCEANARPGAELVVEHRYSSHGIAGTVDAALFDGDTVIIWDYKSGYRPVEVKKNRQLLAYAVLMCRVAPRHVELRIVQPRAYHPDGPVRSWVVPSLEPYRTSLIQAISTVKSGATRLAASPENCTYCRAAGRCEALRDASLAAADKAFVSTADLPVEAVRSDLVALRRASDLISIRLEALEAETRERISRGQAIPGVGIRPGRKKPLSWPEGSDTNQIADMVSMCTDVDPWFAPKIRTPRQMIDAGAPAEMIEKMAERAPGSSVLEVNEDEYLREIFS